MQILDKVHGSLLGLLGSGNQYKKLAFYSDFLFFIFFGEVLYFHCNFHFLCRNFQSKILFFWDVSINLVLFHFNYLLYFLYLSLPFNVKADKDTKI